MTDSELASGEFAMETLVVRQPIFNRDKSVWGYGLAASDAAAGSLSDLVSFYRQAMASCAGEMGSDRKYFITIDREHYLDGTPSPRDVADCIFGISGGAACSLNCVGFSETMRSLGGGVAIDADAIPEEAGELARGYDIVSMSMAGKTPRDIVRQRNSYKDFKGEFLLTDVMNWETFEGTRALGFNLFQGPFFSVPQIEDDAELRTNAVSKLQLIRELNNPECEMNELAAIISSDVSLSYRILKYINSVSFGLKNKIKSIQQAVSLLGLNELRHWVNVVVMVELDSSPKGEELAYMALQRARFLSTLAGSMQGFPHSANTMFLLGLFSRLDALLSYPMEKAVEAIPLEEGIKAGLCGVENEFSDWLRMLAAVEAGDWAGANAVLERYGACFTTVATEYMRACAWAGRQLSAMK